MAHNTKVVNTVPFSLLATFNLLVAFGLLVATFYIDDPIYRYFCLGAFASLLSATVLLLAVTKVMIWPA